GETIVSGSRQPLVDGARELLARGYDPATPLTMRVDGKAYDSFRPAPISEWAKWTYSESEKHPLKRRPWLPREMPVAVDREAQKSGIEPSAGIPGPFGRQFASTVGRVTGDKQPCPWMIRPITAGNRAASLPSSSQATRWSRSWCGLAQ